MEQDLQPFLKYKRLERSKMHHLNNAVVAYLKKHEGMKWNDCMENNDDNPHLERNFH